MRASYRFTLLLLAALGFLLASPASAEFSYVSEELFAWERSEKEFLDPTQSADGMDPVSHHRLFKFPVQGVAVVLWQAEEEGLIYVEGQGFLGGGSEFEMIMDAKLPEGSDVLYQAWSVNNQAMVGGFVHRRYAAPWAIGPKRISELPAGDYVIQALVRIPDKNGKIDTRAQYSQSLRVVKEDDQVLPPDVDPEPENDQDQGGVVDPPLDLGSPAGFLKMDPAKAGNIYYVSSSDGNDNHDGLSPQTAVKTPERGYELLRDNRNDWLLFKAGDSFTGGLPTWWKSGLSEDKPMIIGVYGQGDRPRFLTDGEGLLNSHSKSSKDNIIRHVRFTGLHAYANLRDPDSRDFAGGRDEETAVRWMANSEDILFEDMKIEFYKDGMVLQGGNWGYPIKDVTVRRCIIVNQYAEENRSHSQGIYVTRTQGTEIDQCFFDHNGWNTKVKKAHRTKFNHNIYCSTNNQPVRVTRCILARGSSHGLQLRPGGAIEQNLFVRNALGFFTTQTDSTVIGNVVLESEDLDDDELRGIGIEVFSLDNATVTHNIVSSRRSQSTRQGMDVGARDRIDVQHNIVWDWLNSKGEGVRINDGGGNHSKNIEASPNRPGGVVFLDPSRDLGSYARHRNWGNDIDDTLSVCANRQRGVWIQEACAIGINAYIREGFQRADSKLINDLNSNLGLTVDLGLQLGF